MTRVTGRWQVLEIDLWDRDAIDLLRPAFIEIGADGGGAFRFIAVEGHIGGRHVGSDGHPAVEIRLGRCGDNDDASGRGWACPETDDSLVGPIYFHRGDDSGFRAAARGGPSNTAAPNLRPSGIAGWSAPAISGGEAGTSLCSNGARSSAAERDSKADASEPP